MSSSIDLEVWVTEPFRLDDELYGFWLAGYPANEASESRGDASSFAKKIVYQDTCDQYRVFRALNRFLANPVSLTHQRVIPLSPSERQRMILKYYEIDEAFLMEVLGKHLSKGLRKDLDEIEEKTGIRLHSCQRQFDNLKRVYKHVEDKEGRLFDNIKMAFKLDDRLAAVYARAVFICDNRLAVDKKALHYLKYEHFSACAQILMDNLTSWEEPEGDDLELHRRFLQELRDVKYGFNHIDEHRALTVAQLPPQLRDKTDSVFKTLTRNIQHIGAGLSHSKELRDIFEDLVEKVVFVLKETGFKKSDADILFNAMLATLKDVPMSGQEADKILATYTRFLSSISQIILILFG